MNGMGRLLTIDDLCRRWGPSEDEPLDRRSVNRIVARLGLHAVRLGHRMVRYRPDDVDDAERAAQLTGRGNRGRHVRKDKAEGPRAKE